MVIKLKTAINAPWLGREEIRAARSVLKTGALSSSALAGGKHVREFERVAASYLKARYVIAVNSGTAALQAALYSLDMKKNDEVLVPSFTFIATANAIASAGAKPVFVDILKDSYTMDPADAAKKITRRTRAIMLVHLYGNVALVEQISEIAKRHNLYVIEDAAQALGSTFKKRHAGTFSDLGCFSMYPSKVATAGEGGFVTTASRDLRDRLLLIRNHGQASTNDAERFGLNLRMPEISAAIAGVQIRKLDKFLKKRSRNADYMTSLLSDTDVRLPARRGQAKTNWYLYTIAARNRDKILKKLNRNGIGATPYYAVPIHRTRLYRSHARLPVTEWAAKHVLSLPIHPQVTKKEIQYIAKIIRGMV